MRSQRRTDARRVPYSDADPASERTLAELRIYCGDLEPAEVTRRLGLVPTGSQSRGEVFDNTSGRQRTAKIAGWFLSSEDKVASKDLRRHVDHLLEALLPRTEALQALQEVEGVTMELRCIWWSAGGGGPVLWPEQLAGLARLEVEVGFEVADYGADERARTDDDA